MPPETLAEVKAGDEVSAPSEWLDLAAAELQRVGFEIKYASHSGSRYFHLPGRVGGMLRLSDHSKEKPFGVAAMLTIHAANYPKSEHKMRRMIAEVIGWYFLNTEAKT